jgi:hypothetical protein
MTPLGRDWIHLASKIRTIFKHLFEKLEIFRRDDDNSDNRSNRVLPFPRQHELSNNSKQGSKNLELESQV